MAPISQLLPDLLTSSGPLGIAVLGFALCVLALYAVDQHVLSPSWPKGVAVLREPAGARRFSLRNRLAFHLDSISIHREAWDKYLSKGKPVIIPSTGFGSEIMLPPTSYRWLSSQPDNVASVWEAFAQFDRVYYSLGAHKYITDPYQGMLVKTEMNPMLEAIVAAMNDELGFVFDMHLGNVPGEWKEIELQPVVGFIVAQAASRFTVGLPLCRNQDYIRNCLAITKNLFITAGTGAVLPRVLEPLACRLASLPLKSKVALFRKHVEPIHRERLALLKRQDPNQPNDHFQLILKYAQRERPEELEDTDCMARRLCVANFGSMHQTAIQVTNLILNILGSDAEFNTIAALRDEMRRVLNSDGDVSGWTKAKVSKMLKADSVARETLRLQSFGGRANFRKILVDGVKTDDGIELPKGSIVSMMSKMPQTDEKIYPDDPLKFDPFRFSRMRETADAKSDKAGENGGPTAAPPPPVSFVTTSLDHMPFGHGKHACPGRFLVDFELKMIMAYLLTHYDVEFPNEYNGQRPPNVYVTEAHFPPAGARIRVRRRESPAI
ncbi:cytochrome P450 [Apodospora peruviana]|uniref:Cytochrome P450 n=1 Tax=Apodospora peruviana TaxID=516989 RepID=A0AAE0HUS7_9PEZI|nr:cytochrome P450 [Apodospora peruviana]